MLREVEHAVGKRSAVCKGSRAGGEAWSGV